MEENKKNISLSDLIGGSNNNSKTSAHIVDHTPLDSNSAKELKPEDIAPMKKDENKEPPINQNSGYYEKLINNGIERVKKELIENVEAPMVKALEAKQEQEEFNGNTNIEDTKTMSDIISNKKYEMETYKTPVKEEHQESKAIDVNKVNVEENLSSAKDLDFDENDFKDTSDNDDIDDSLEALDESGKTEEEQEKSDEEKKKEFLDLQAEIKKYISPKAIDVSKYTISNTSLSINSAMSRITNSDPSFSMSKSVPLYNTGKTISFTPLTGAEIVAMSDENYNSQLEAYRKTFNIMYNHDTTIDRTKVTFTNWLKSIDAGDIYQLYFGLYNSTFGDSNYISYQCPDCNTFFMMKKPIEDMYSVDEDAKKEQIERLENIRKYESVEDNLESRTRSYPLSENYIIEIHPRTLFNIIEMEYLDDAFKKKYMSILQPMSFINKIFYIDNEKKRLIPIDMKPDHNSIIKTIKNKCTVIYKLISSIKPDEYSMLTGILTSYAAKEMEAVNLIRYHIPEADCQGTYKTGENKGKKCTHHFDKTDVIPYQMLFTRHQLAMQSTLRVE